MTLSTKEFAALANVLSVSFFVFRNEWKANQDTATPENHPSSPPLPNTNTSTNTNTNTSNDNKSNLENYLELKAQLRKPTDELIARLGLSPNDKLTTSASLRKEACLIMFLNSLGLYDLQTPNSSTFKTARFMPLPSSIASQGFFSENEESILSTRYPNSFFTHQHQQQQRQQQSPTPADLEKHQQQQEHNRSLGMRGLFGSLLKKQSLGGGNSTTSQPKDSLRKLKFTLK